MFFGAILISLKEQREERKAHEQEKQRRFDLWKQIESLTPRD